MWTERYASVCRQHPDLIAVYESPRRDLALLLRQPLVPPADDEPGWVRLTRRVARQVLTQLREAGFGGDVFLLQGRPLTEVARIVDRWHCRYVAAHAHLEPRARSPLAEELLEPTAAQGFVDKPDPLLVPRVARWYHEMAGCWLDAEPTVRRQLILACHQWIVESVLLPLARGQRPALEELRPGDRLTTLLKAGVPGDDEALWAGWITLVVADLERALRWPVARHHDAWLRWLFLIPYSVPVARRPGPSARSDDGAACCGWA